VYDTLWAAPKATTPVSGEVKIPGSKSIVNRALILAAISTAPTHISNVPASRDTALMLAALASLGVQIDQSSFETLTIGPIPSGLESRAENPITIDCGLAGTVMRFVPPIAALGRGAIEIDGDPRARERPLAPLIQALTQLGVCLTAPVSASLPLHISATGAVRGGVAQVDASGSSQFVSALLMAGARFENGLQLQHSGAPVPSLPHIAMTCQMLSEHGVRIVSETSNPTTATWSVAPSAVMALDRTIEPDLSNAMPFVAAAMVTGGTVRIPSLTRASLQPLDRVMSVFGDLGAKFDVTAAGFQVAGSGTINGITANLGDIGELVPTVAALAALADSPSELTGIGHLAGHETDRLAALATEISAMGSGVARIEDGLRITPRPLEATAVWRTYHDHRMATAGAILGLVTPGVMIENIATTGKTFPTFPNQWLKFVTGNPQNTDAKRHAP
jgi:3-phosphoshikimate 1-carboxyvinyltransferase